MSPTGVLVLAVAGVLWGLAEWRSRHVGVPRWVAQQVAYAPDSLGVWLDHAAACAGRPAPRQRVRTSIAPDLGYSKFVNLATVAWDSVPVLGLYDHARRRIVVRESHRDSGRVWRHELTHYVRQDSTNSHAPVAEFACAEFPEYRSTQVIHY